MKKAKLMKTVRFKTDEEYLNEATPEEQEQVEKYAVTTEYRGTPANTLAWIRFLEKTKPTTLSRIKLAVRMHTQELLNMKIRDLFGLGGRR